MTANKNELVGELEAMSDHLAMLKLVTPSDEAEYRDRISELQSASKRIKSLKTNSIRMADMAGEVGMTADATKLEELCIGLERQERGLEADCQGLRSEYGFTQSGTTKTYEVKPPKFSGNTKDMDFFTFVKRWEDFVSCRVMSKADAFRTLTLVSLEGTARELVEDLDSVDDAMELLRQNYGDPRILLIAKLEDIRKSGKSEGTALKKRDWFILLKGKLQAVQKLSVTHEIETELYFSEIISEVKERLPTKTQDDYMTALKVKSKDPENPLTRKVMYNLMITCLEECTSDMTLAMKFEPAARLKSGLEPARKPEPKPTSAKPGNKKTFIANPAVPAVDGSSKQTRTAAPKKKKPIKSSAAVNAVYVPPKLVKCPLCDEQHTFLYYCTVFLNAPLVDRRQPGGRSRACFRCLRLDSKVDFKNQEQWKAEHQVNCISEWVCKEGECKNREYKNQYHILMCRHHSQENKQLENDFVKQMDKAQVKPGVKYFFARSLFMPVIPQIVPVHKMIEGYTVKKDIQHISIFMLQYVKVNEQSMLLFYDSGCMTAGLSNRAAGILGSVEVREGPTMMEVAGGGHVKLDHGDEQFHLDLVEPNTKATITGLRMDSVTSVFPLWTISEAWESILKDYNKTLPNGPELPLPPDSVGGCEVDLMLGIKYLVYFPDLITNLPSGLGIFRSKIAAPGNRTLVLGGPHPAWNHAIDAANFTSPHAYLSMEARAWYSQANTLKHVYAPVSHACESDEEEWDNVMGTGWGEEVAGGGEVCVDACNNKHCDKHQGRQDWMVPRNWNLDHTAYSLRDSTNRFLEAELSGSEVQYRCLRCRNCNDCKKGETLEPMSMKEEAEQFLIEKSVRFDADAGKLIAKLPFVLDPETHLKPNRYIAEKIFEGQLKKISADEDTRIGVLAAFDKLASKDYVRELSSFPPDIQELINDPPSPDYFIPWRFVYKESSISTPIRIVFDASSVTPGGESLNSCLAKGENRLMKISHLLMRFRTGAAAFAADIKMAYNNLALDPIHYRFQKFLWKHGLDPSNPIIVMIVCTLIYGVKPVGNQLQGGFVNVGDHCIEHFPEHTEGALSVIKDSYVDDLLRAARNLLAAKQIAESVRFTLSLAGMSCKAFTFSGEPPPPEVSSDGLSVGLIGMIWEPEKDVIGIDIKDLYLGKAKRGKLPALVTGDVMTALSKRFTKRILLGKTAGVFDPLGLLTPVTCKLKLDMQIITELKTDWDEKLPDKYLMDWVENLDMIQRLKEVRFRRTIIPADAASDTVDLIVSSDASQNIAITCIHARVRLRSGEYSVQLLTAKSKLVRYKTIPKGEIRAAVMGASLGHVAKTNLGSKYGDSIYVTDSTVALHWIA